MSIKAIEEILRQPDLKFRNGRRDFTLLSLMYESAARISEIADLCIGDLHFERSGAIVHLRGKGKKFRDVPLIRDASSLLKNYLSEEKHYRPCEQTEPLFCNRDKNKLTRAGISYIFNKYVNSARSDMPYLLPTKVYPHIFRHSRAMHWLEAGVDLQYIKDLLGHADLSTTEVYAQLNIEMKRKILEEVHPGDSQSSQYPSWTDDQNLMSWLRGFRDTH